MNITIINDCRDANAAGRQVTRASALMNSPVSFVGVSNDLEAAGNLIDTLDAYEEAPGTILVNVAPRNGKAKKWQNGTPFGYFWYKNILVVASIDGFTLSLVKKLGLVDHINVLDIPTTVDQFISEKIITESVGKHIKDTQFRSYDFVPRITAYLQKYKDAKSEKHPIEDFADAPPAIWWVDNFGNCKTTLLQKEISNYSPIDEKVKKLDYFERLKDVPDKTVALITGSSGLGDNRFLEIVAQGESAAKLLNLSSGDTVFENKNIEALK